MMVCLMGNNTNELVDLNGSDQCWFKKNPQKNIFSDSIALGLLLLNNLVWFVVNTTENFSIHYFHLVIVN